MNVSPGETYVDQYYIVNDSLSEIMDTDKAAQWSDSTVRQKYGVQDDIGEYHNGEAGRGISLVRYGSQDDFYVSLLETEYATCAVENATSTTCQGRSVPRPDHYAYFYIECGPDQHYTGPDRYHFTPLLSDTGGILEPHLCQGHETNSTIRSKLTLVGFFPDDESCDALESLKFDPELCLETFVDDFQKEIDFQEESIDISSHFPSESPTSNGYLCEIDNGVDAPDEGSLDFLSELALDDSAGNLATPWEYVSAADVEGADPYFYTSPSGLVFLIQPIYYSGVPYQGNCTRVFAWLSLPVDDLSASPIPGAVLLHGGGGSAFKLWCEEWAKRDMASIAIAHEGQTDVKLPEQDEYRRAWERHDWAGPFRSGRAYSDVNLPNLNDQWMYHAVAQTILANTLLRSESSVKANEVGVTGVSWGGVITSTVIGLDHRFAFAIPGYGCGSLGESLGHFGRQIELGGDEIKDAYNEVWDPIIRFGSINHTLPTLWISFPEEAHFPLVDQAATYRSLLSQASSASVLPVLIPHLLHGHSPIWNREENYEFVRSVLSSPERPMFAKQIAQFSGVEWLPIDFTTQKTVTVKFESTQDFSVANLISSTGALSIVSSDRTWLYEPVTSSSIGGSFWKDESSCMEERCEWYATATLPPGTTSWYINLCTASNNICASSLYNEAAPARLIK
jgi:dienelactone hydrolase